MDPRLRIIEDLSKVYTIDFFVERPFNRILPKCWQETLEKMEASTLRSLADSSLPLPLSTPLPLGLCCLRVLSHYLSPSRTPLDGPRDIANVLGVDGENLPSTFTSACTDSELSRKIKRKKQHEIDRIVHLVGVARQKRNFSTLIDIGAGSGHLSRILALQFPDLDVHTIEGNDTLVATSSLLDSRFRNRFIDWNGPQRKAEYVRLDEETELPGEGGVCLIGVHTCGDLSSSIIRMFADHPQTKVLILFCCCYHKLNDGRDKMFKQEWKKKEGEEENSSCGYPLCSTSPSLSYAARELACHAREKWVNEDGSSIPIQLRRALLEMCIVESTLSSGVCYRHLPMRKVRHAGEMPFEEYMEKTLADHPEVVEKVKEMLSSSSLSFPSLLSSSAHSFLSMLSLRYLIAPLIEGILLDDRLRYLREKGIESYQIPLFDPILSPRNACIIAFKD